MCGVVVSRKMCGYLAQTRDMAPLWPLLASSTPSYLGSDSSWGGVCGCPRKSWPVGEKTPLQDMTTRVWILTCSV